MFTFVYCMIIVFRTFFGKYHPERLEHHAKEAPFGMLISPIILACFVIGIFLFPNVLGDSLLRPALTSVFQASLK
ncbi:hypothetical protein ACI2OX_05460 [Bacillus sp. N9]